MNPRSTYDSDPIAFDRAKVLSDLGISSLEDVQIIGVNSDGSYAQETSATNGFWYDLNGFAGSHGDGAGIMWNIMDWVMTLKRKIWTFYM